VINTLFKMNHPDLPAIQHNDIDLLCFADPVKMQQTLDSIKLAGYRTAVRQNVKANVFVITFHATEQGLSQEIEIIFLPPDHRSRMRQLCDLFIDYGINWTLCYDLANQTIVDPAKQLDRISRDKELDVSDPRIDLVSCFEKNPGLILYIIEKAVLFEPYGVKLSQRVQEALHKLSIANMQINPGRKLDKIPLSRITKLFLTGSAEKAVQQLLNFKLVHLVFPLATNNLQPVLSACYLSDIDEQIQSCDKYFITAKEWERRQANFIGNALFNDFCASRSTQTYHGNHAAFKEES
jgi:hypothetical protein